MSLGIGFGDDGKVYGLLYPMGLPEQHRWEMAFYSSERTRKGGITYLHKLLGGHCPILKFELTLSEIREFAVLAPFIPKDHTGKLDHVVKPKCAGVILRRFQLRERDLLGFLPEGHRTVDEICEKGAKKEIFAGYYGDHNIPKVCPYCGGEIVLRHKPVSQDDTVPVGICAKCDIAWVTKERNG